MIATRRERGREGRAAREALTLELLMSMESVAAIRTVPALMLPPAMEIWPCEIRFAVLLALWTTRVAALWQWHSRGSARLGRPEGTKGAGEL